MQNSPERVTSPVAIHLPTNPPTRANTPTRAQPFTEAGGAPSSGRLSVDERAGERPAGECLPLTATLVDVPDDVVNRLLRFLDRGDIASLLHASRRLQALPLDDTTRRFVEGRRDVRILLRESALAYRRIQELNLGLQRSRHTQTALELARFSLASVLGTVTMGVALIGLERSRPLLIDTSNFVLWQPLRAMAALQLGILAQRWLAPVINAPRTQAQLELLARSMECGPVPAALGEYLDDAVLEAIERSRDMWPGSAPLSDKEVIAQERAVACRLARAPVERTEGEAARQASAPVRMHFPPG